MPPTRIASAGTLGHSRTPPSSGTLNVTQFTGAFTYTPAPDFYTPEPGVFGEVKFSYSIKDLAGATGTAEVTIVVTPVNDPPLAGNDTVDTAEDTPRTLEE